ncbi:hypothetical protein [Leptolyngbya sp. FACHB-239]|uniref:hypothetical protein n=1 Tax=Leptolyngbya sp. FACHB-239 TaxID=2692805 RepID=UPI001181B1EB|nr:hypothetical protein [Leptolyngbya sp. FACHB-239]MBD2402029.1 hypothetical protein [Leptolyngbya sp. FACHB-239]
MVETKHDNQAEFRRLEEEDRWIMAAYAVAAGALTASVVIPELFLRTSSFLGGTIGSRFLLTRTQKVNSILRNGKALDEAFRDQEIQIFTDLPVPDHGRLDLFIKFPLPPKKTVFTIALRSQGKGTVFYNEQKEALYIRTGSSGLKPWKPDHIERLALQEFWLRMNRQAELFGTSSRDRNRSAVKLLVLTGQTRIGQHSDSLYTTVGDQRVLLLRRRSSIYVLEESQLLPFIKAWLVPTGQ